MSDSKQLESYSCKICNKADDSQMVSCDTCEKWFHFQCVGVTAEIEHEEWQCAACTTMAENQKGTRDDRNMVGKVTKNTGQGNVSGGLHAHDGEGLGTGQAGTHTPAGANQTGAAHSKASVKSTKSRRQRAEASLIAEELDILRKREALIERRRKLLQSLETEDECSDLEEGFDSIAVDKWLNATGPAVPNLMPPKATLKGHSTSVALPTGASATLAQPKGATDDANIQRQLTTSHVQSTVIKRGHDTKGCFSWTPNVVPVDLSAQIGQQKKVESTSLQPLSLTKNQIAARTSVGKELPKFNGKPEEWPLFLATYQQTTELCGFSEGENLLRLRHALEGAARDAVRNLLLHTSCVPQILSTLKMKFGRPELIIAVLLARIREIPAVKENRLETLVDLALEVQNVCATMKASNMLGHLNNPELEQELVNKLPGLLAAFWGMHKLNLTSCNLESFADWLFQLAQGANSVIVPATSSKGSTKRGYLNAHAGDIETKEDTCVICYEMCGMVENCNKFRAADRSERWDLVRKHNLCRRCLNVHSRVCPRKATCGVNGCVSLHHPLLHKQSSPTVSPRIDSAHNAHSGDMASILFKVLPITLHGNNIKIKTYAFFDDGSSLTLMNAALQKRLKLSGTAQPLCLKWTANTHRYEDDSQVLTLDISGSNTKRRFTLRDVHTVKELDLPKQTVDIRQLQNKYAHLRGLPLSSYSDAVPQLLIGLNNTRVGLTLRSREGSDDEPVAEKTPLGWTIKGVLSSNRAYSGYHAFHMCDCDSATNTELIQTVKNYFCLDNLDVSGKAADLISEEDRQAIAQLKNTTKRVEGRFETGLIWKCTNRTLPDSLPLALRRAQCLQAKLTRDPELAEILSSKIGDYVHKGYATPLSHESLLDTGCWYLPIFPVRNPNKPNKTRIVWDAAAKTKGVSLNTVLLKGPDQLACMLSILRRFRERPIALTGDIEEMFHQIRIRSHDQNYQRFVWLPPGATEPSVFKMNVMTFGATCSPSTAQYVKNLNAEEFRGRYPRAAECIINNHYVDDMLDSVSTIEEAITLAKDVIYVHGEGGFHIRNWRSNSEEVLLALGANTDNSGMNLNPDQELQAEKVLGLWWLTREDCFTFRVSKHHKNGDLLHSCRCPTKREVLSVIMSIFDPLGLLNFYVVYAKILFQKIWRSGSGWDDHIIHEHYSEWLRWVHLLPGVEALKIPRCYFNNLNNDSDLEMHIFVDASENAYAATCYLRHTLGNNVDCKLVGSKVKVAPLKMLSIPRLELQAAVLGARLATAAIASHTLNIRAKTFWTDSRTVLAWIRSDHRRYSPFVAFRVGEILELTDTAEWRWIPSAENVADDATKWHATPDVSGESPWFNGPTFLQRDRDTWPIDSKEDEHTTEELRAKFQGHHNIGGQKHCTLTIHERYSRWSRLVHVMATVVMTFRIWKLYHKGAKINCRVEQRDVNRAEKVLWREAQYDAFADEIALLSKGKTVNRSSSIYKLSPYLDECSLIRIGGRIDRPGWQDQIVLPKAHNITRLIVSDFHIRYRHGNAETVVNEIRQQFWIPHLRTVVKQVRRDCQICRLQDATPQPPKMGKLPAARATPFMRPFTYVGVDYFGPLSVSVRRSTEKRYGVLFTCLTTRAIHLEVACSLSADSCILAVRSFMTRRGVPTEFWSDNATNFKATQRELAEAFDLMDKDRLIRAFTSSSLKWIFIPPLSPHMGGAWERLVRSVKDVLYKILHSQRPSDELLRGALMEVESIVNSRPLTYIPLDYHNDEALTPNHFLVGSSNGMKPLLQPSDEPLDLRKGWKCAQNMADIFWRRWVREYLPVITRRTKWFENVQPIRVGDVVYIVDPNGPRSCWPKGKVISVKMAADGQVRSALVQTNGGIYDRPATRLAVLSIGTAADKVDPVDIPGGSVKKGVAAP